MNLLFKDKQISGVLTVLPDKDYYFDDEMKEYNFSKAQSLKLKLVMGYNKHRMVEEGVCSSDLCIKGIEHLLSSGYLKKDEIDALVVVTQSPDYLMPPTSYVIHGHLGLKQDAICLDINQGCAGYVLGLYNSFMLLEQPSISKVLLCNVDILSRKVSPQDRNSYPLIGDGASITIVEKSASPNTIYGEMKVDGSRADALMIPAGGFRTPSSSATEVLNEDEKGNLRAANHLVMKGDAVFNFVQMEVPPLINHLLETAEVKKEEVDYFLFHQPNRFMLQKLADGLGVPREKLPSNIVENFGNASGVTIPTALCFNYADSMKQTKHLCCLAGFGVGLTWAALLMDIGELAFCEIIDF